MKRPSYEIRLNLKEFKNTVLENKNNIRWFNVWDSVFLMSMSFLVSGENGSFRVYKFNTKTGSTFDRLKKWLLDNGVDCKKVG